MGLVGVGTGRHRGAAMPVRQTDRACVAGVRMGEISGAPD